MECYELIQLFCDLLLERIRIITHDKICPNDLLGPVSTLIWCSDRVEIEELVPVRNQLYYKFGSSFVQEAQNNSNCMVNASVLKKLSIEPPSAYQVQRYLKEIAKEFKVDWSPEFEILPDDPAHCLPPSGIQRDALRDTRVPPPPPDARETVTADKLSGDGVHFAQATLFEQPPPYESVFQNRHEAPSDDARQDPLPQAGGQPPMSDIDALAERLAALKGAKR